MILHEKQSMVGKADSEIIVTCLPSPKIRTQNAGLLIEILLNGCIISFYYLRERGLIMKLPTKQIHQRYWQKINRDLLLMLTIALPIAVLVYMIIHLE